MYDYFKYHLIDHDLTKLLENTLLNFSDKIYTDTGELGSYKVAYYHNLKFIMFYPTEYAPNGRLTVEGSFHKYWNNGAHNFNDFGYQDFLLVLNDWESKFGINPKNCRLMALEVGVNLSPPIKTNDILKNCLYYSTKKFKDCFVKDEGEYRQASAQRFYVKLYNKRLHYEKKGFVIGKEIFRVERKYSKSEELKNIGVLTIKDLLNFDYNIFKNELCQMWKKVLFYDEQLLKTDKYSLEYNAPIFWEGLSRDKRKYHTKRIKSIYDQNENSIKNNVLNLICQKIDSLNIKTPHINPLGIRLKWGESKTNKLPANRRFCKVTGINISMQKEGSILLSHTGLKYYCQTDKTIYLELKEKYLSRKWRESDHLVQIKEIAHNIRNAKSNQNNRQKTLYKSHQTNLLNQFSLI